MHLRKNGMATSPDKTSMHNNVARFLVLLAALLLVAFVAVPYVTDQSGGAAKQQQGGGEPARDDVLARLAKAGVAAAGEPIITKLAGVEELKKAKPIIYRNAKDGQYEARWPTLLVIYDYETDSIVNSLSITQVRLPE